MTWHLKWWRSFQRNANFWDWLQDTYSEQELRQLVAEATDTPLIRPWDPFSDTSNDPFSNLETNTRELSRALMKRYGRDIWHACLGAGGYNPDERHTGIDCLARLDFAFQVHDPDTFNEFMVRNAIKRGARQVLEDR